MLTQNQAAAVTNLMTSAAPTPDPIPKISLTEYLNRLKTPRGQLDAINDRTHHSLHMRR